VSLAWWNGQAVPDDAVHIAPGDAGFLYGDGLFETLRIDDGHALDVTAHLDRLLAGLQRVEIEIPDDRGALAGAIAVVAAKAPRPFARLRLTVTRGASSGPTVLITAAPYEPPREEAYEHGVGVLLVPELRVDSKGPLAGLKSLCWQAKRLAFRHAEAAGAFEALLLNERGLLAEGSRSNVVLVLDDGVFTPPESDGCLPGTVRRRLLEEGTIAERSLSPDDLRSAREVLLLNSLVGALPVSRVADGGGEVRAGLEVGQAAALLRRALAERVPGHR
jgi:branched-subunit amino acid aminotransferase/4-amino-4-deoxychorismate lyase